MKLSKILKGSSASTTHSCVTSNNIRTINKDVNPDILSNSADHQENHDEGLSESASTVHSHIYSSHIRTINLDVNQDIVLSTSADHQNDENIRPERHLKDNVPMSPLTANVKKTKQKNVSSILEELEDCPVEDEKG
ncbi:uncharacterized protein LOC124458165 [Xenia sp. Carnegie-2017]|uniref:uncharacterized protein LOC124458165 n=1 Tax=Xenia sp. Carnegie-2017 TaxID=2897299 RepID=UPI001F03BF06|nr:uncharacterized protein LOC124458165 [Xenia sp. Carnegie-2017]